MTAGFSPAFQRCGGSGLGGPLPDDALGGCLTLGSERGDPVICTPAPVGLAAGDVETVP